MAEISRDAACYALEVLTGISGQCKSGVISKMLSRSVFLGKRVLAHDTDAADELYDCIDNEDDSFSIMQEETESRKEKAMFDCIIYAAAILVRYAYEEDNRKYFPEPIELVGESTVDALKCAVSEFYGLSD